MGNRKLGSIVSLIRGNTYKSALLNQDGPYLLGLASIGPHGGFRKDKLKTYGGPSAEKHILYTGDMFISLKDITQQALLLGAIARVPDEIKKGRLTQDTVKLSFTDTTYPKEYFYWALRSPQYREYCKARALGTTNLSLSREDFLDFELPSYTSQRQQIVNILELIEKKINLNENINKYLEQLSKLIFKSWFVDFDPVIDNALDAGNPIPEALQSRAELRQKVRNCADFKPLPAEIRSLFPSEFEETELGWVPKGWSIVRTEDIALKIGMGPFGSNIKVSTFVNAGVPIISGQHLKDPLLIDGDNNFITPEHAEKLKNSAVYRKDIIFTHAGNIGQVSLIPEDSEYDRYIISQRQFFLRVNESKSSPYYLIHYFRSEKGQHALLSNASQVGVPSIARPSTHLKNISFLNPPMVLLKEFEKFSTPLFHRFSKNRKCGVSLTALRDTLLPKLISGELSLEDLPDLTTNTEAA